MNEFSMLKSNEIVSLRRLVVCREERTWLPMMATEGLGPEDEHASGSLRAHSLTRASAQMFALITIRS